MLKVSFTFNKGANKFKQSFNDAKEFNVLFKSGEKEKIVFAPVVSDFKIKVSVSLKREVRSLSFSGEIVNRETSVGDLLPKSTSLFKEESEKEISN
jgi:hypothetical protein